jgi:hypothetical protein
MPRRPSLIEPGAQYGFYVILNEEERNITPNGTIQRKFKVKCRCGSETIITYSSLVKNKSCGCKPRVNEVVDLSIRYNRLTLLNEEPSISGKRKVKVLCDCGKTKVVSLSTLKDGRTQSCGCLQKERTKEYNEKIRKEKTAIF